jgi:hypothetical protein
LKPTRRVARISATPEADASVEFPLRVHDADRLEQLVAEYARADGELPELARKAITTRRDWLRAERVVDGARQRWEGDGTDMVHAGQAGDRLAESALRLRAALSEVHSVVSDHAALGHAAAETSAWEYLRGAYEWIAVVFGQAPEARKGKRAPVTRRAPARRPKA